MKSNHWLILFSADAILHLITTVYSIPTLNLITKPLLMILLAGYFVSLIGNADQKFKIIILLALLFSWFGDTFLMLQRDNPLFFILGLGSFLFAHIAYIVGFKKFNARAPISIQASVSIVFFLYTIALLYVLWDGLVDMKIPVVLYAIVLTIMGVVGVIKNYRVNNLIVVGVMLFIVSDSMIAYDKFVEPITSSRFLIMSSYILAQFLIIRGISDRITSVST